MRQMRQMRQALGRADEAGMRADEAGAAGTWGWEMRQMGQG